MSDNDSVMDLLKAAKRLAQKYRVLTGKPLGITGEVAEYEAARLLGVELTPARQAGYDALETHDSSVRKLQIKGRCLLDNCKPGQRLGSIRIEKQWDAVLMVLLDQNFDAVEIYEADRAAVIAALMAPGSKARNERGALSVTKFKSVGKLRWRRPTAVQRRGVTRLKGNAMSQDRVSGAVANEWGRRKARAIALQLGATKLTDKSNECFLNGERIVIKCSAPATDSVGVTFKMLARLNSVVGAFQRDDGVFQLWSLAPSVFEKHMRDTRSRKNVGKLGLVRRDVFETEGKALGEVRL